MTDEHPSLETVPLDSYRAGSDFSLEHYANSLVTDPELGGQFT